MKTSIRIPLVGVALIAAVIGRAQTLPPDRAPTGVLGNDYAELSFGVQDFKHLGPDFHDVWFAGNASPLAHVDFRGGCGFGWIGGDLQGHAVTFAGAATMHARWRGVTPFAGVDLGYEWLDMPGADNAWLWGAHLGVEVPAGRFLTFTPRLAYADDFRSAARSAPQWTGSAELNCWLTRSTALFATLGYTDVRRSPFDSWHGRLGLRWAF
jgi:hypothetical protein